MEVSTGIEIDGEYRALRGGAGLLDRSDRGKLLARGREAAELLQGQLTNDVEALGPGEGCYAALLDRKGHMQADMRVLRLADGGLWLDTEPETREGVLRHLRMYSVGLDVELEDATDSRAILSLIGPGATEASGAGRLAPEHAHETIERKGVEVVAVATDLGVDLIADAADVDSVRAELLASGPVEVGEAATEIVRVETGRPRFGREMTGRTIPAEAGINERAVSFTKGCYIGQETVARLHYKGRPNRHLRGLRLAGPAAAGDAVRLGERELGTIGTAVISPAHGPIALAILRREAEPGATVRVGEELAAEVVQLPF